MSSVLDGLLERLDADQDVEEIDSSLVPLLGELVRLEREEREVSALRRKLHDRLASFPNPATEARERELSAQRRELHRRIDELRARLGLADYREQLASLRDRPAGSGQGDVLPEERAR
jgi:hypothetical protein